MLFEIFSCLITLLPFSHPIHSGISRTLLRCIRKNLPFGSPVESIACAVNTVFARTLGVALTQQCAFDYPRHGGGCHFCCGCIVFIGRRLGHARIFTQPASSCAPRRAICSRNGQCSGVYDNPSHGHPGMSALGLLSVNGGQCTRLIICSSHLVPWRTPRKLWRKLLLLCTNPKP